MRYLPILFLLVLVPVQAGTIDFTNAGIYGTATGQPNFFVVDQGIGLTLDTAGTLFGGTLSQTVDGLGVTGPFQSADPDEIGVTEHLSVGISPGVTLENILITKLFFLELGQYRINGGDWVPFQQTGFTGVLTIPVNLTNVTTLEFGEQGLLSDYSVHGFGFQAIPEPATFALMGSALLAFGALRSKRRTPPGR